MIGWVASPPLLMMDVNVTLEVCPVGLNRHALGAMLELKLKLVRMDQSHLYFKFESIFMTTEWAPSPAVATPPAVATNDALDMLGMVPLVPSEAAQPS